MGAIRLAQAGADALHLPTGETWEKRKRPTAYTGPESKRRLPFIYEETGRSTPLRRAVFQFPGVGGAYIQDNGIGPRSYPVRAYFSGANHDLEATAFEQLLLERGRGKLETPLYGPISVIPMGTITRREDLVREGNQSVVEVTFSTSLASVYPGNVGDAQNEILAAVADFDSASADKFAAATVLQKATQLANAKATIRGYLGEVKAFLAPISKYTSDRSRSFQDNFDILNEGIDTLVGEPTLLARQIAQTIRAPARAGAAISDRLEGYRLMMERVIGSPGGNPSLALVPGTKLKDRTIRTANDFHIADLFATQGVAGAIASASSTPIEPIFQTTAGVQSPGGAFQTKSAVLQAADALLAQLETVVDWRDTALDALEGTPNVEAYQVDGGGAAEALARAALLAAGRLVESSFSLLPERRIVLGRPRTAIDLAWELYGSVDDRLDFLATSNDFSGDDWLELVTGREIVYYSEA